MNVWIAMVFPFTHLPNPSGQQYHSELPTTNAGAYGGGLPACPVKIVEVIQHWLDQIDVHDRNLAKWLCPMIPHACPFERNIQLFGRIRFCIPPLCKLNPFYEQFVGLRFRALCYLADVCGEDITEYSR